MSRFLRYQSSWISHLAYEIGGLLLNLLGHGNSVLEGRVVNLARLELRDDVKAGQLLAVLIESKSVVLLFGFAGLAALALGLLAGRSVLSDSGRLTRRSICPTGRVGGGIPLVGLGGSVGSAAGLGLEFRNTLVPAPALVDLLLRVAGISIVFSSRIKL